MYVDSSVKRTGADRRSGVSSLALSHVNFEWCDEIKL